MPERRWPPLAAVSVSDVSDTPATPAAASVPSPSAFPAAGGEGAGVDVVKLLAVASHELRRARGLYERGFPRYADQCCDDAQRALALARRELERDAARRFAR